MGNEQKEEDTYHPTALPLIQFGRIKKRGRGEEDMRCQSKRRGKERGRKLIIT